MATLAHSNDRQVKAFLAAWQRAARLDTPWTDDPTTELEVARRLWTAMARWPPDSYAGHLAAALAAYTSPARMEPSAPPAAVAQGRRAALLLSCRPWISERSFWTTFRRLSLPFVVPVVERAPEKGSLKRIRRLKRQPVQVSVSGSFAIAAPQPPKSSPVRRTMAS
jgi:hypothetical protein